MANLKINILAQDKTKGALRSVKGGLASIKNAVFSLKGAFITLGGAVALRGIANVGSNFEDLRDSLASVTGGVKQGAEAFDFVNRFALKSQFSVEQLTTSFITLKASGIEPTEKLLRMFTDTSAVTTDQLGTLDAMTRVFSRGIQGGLGLEELNQIADRGVPVFKILEEQLGITRLEIAKYGQTTDGALKILNALEKGFGDAFGGATQQKLDNLSTSSSNLGIAFRNQLDVIGQAGFSGALTTMNNTIAKTLNLLTPLAEKLGIGLGKVVDGLTLALDTLNLAIERSFEQYKKFREFLGIPLPDPVTISKTPAFNIHEGMKIPDTRTGLDKIKEQLDKLVNKEIQSAKDQFEKIHEIVAKGIVQGIKQTSRGLAEMVVLGKSFGETLKKIAQNVLINIIAKQIEYIALLGIQKILGKEDETQQAKKDNLIRKQNTNLKRQIGLQLILNALGGGSGGFLSTSGGSMKRASGGSVQKGQPYMVGEQGAELFVPNQSGQIHQSARGGKANSSTTVNFNINTVDASGFEELLVRSRGAITQLINNAVNERGAKSLI
jgi:hypothetical protein